ncbi:MAG TPA: NADPH:quinone oxidoreductase family protein [Actinomycetota bacterium]|nr:NADPH:quinone oxidoreductase family protein [Actinomycetota bacterium]
MTIARAWRVHDWCEPHGMKLEEIDVPEPDEGHVRISVRAAALNFFDLLLIQGKYQVKPPFPFTPGAEISGVVDAVGPGVRTVKRGDRVMAQTSVGGYTESVIAPAGTTFAMPEGMSFAEGAAMPIVYHTSYFALRDRAHLQPGEWLLVHAGASGVGMSAIQLGKAWGANVIATASSEDKLAFCVEQGADHAINYSDPQWVDAVKQITKRGADVIYDPVGGDIFDLSSKCIASEGRLLVIGFAGGRIPEIAANRILLKNMSVVGVFWGGYANGHPSYPAETHAALMDLYGTGKIKPVVSNTVRFEDAPDAMQALTTRTIVGKTVLEIGG